jgi:hypothetical protein
MNEQKIYRIPPDTRIYLIKILSLMELKDEFVKEKDFENATRCNFEKQQNILTFWNEIYLLYPELKYKKIQIDDSGNEIKIIEENNKEEN